MRWPVRELLKSERYYFYYFRMSLHLTSQVSKVTITSGRTYGRHCSKNGPLSMWCACVIFSIMQLKISWTPNYKFLFILRQSTIDAARSRDTFGPSIHPNIEYLHIQTHRKYFTAEFASIDPQCQFKRKQLHANLPKWTERSVGNRLISVGSHWEACLSGRLYRKAFDEIRANNLLFDGWQ